MIQTIIYSTSEPMKLSQVSFRSERSGRKLSLWFTNKEKLKQKIPDLEWGLWLGQKSTQGSQMFMSVSREHNKVLSQKHYSLLFNKKVWHTLHMYKCCAVVTIEEVLCYEPDSGAS